MIYLLKQKGKKKTVARWSLILHYLNIKGHAEEKTFGLRKLFLFSLLITILLPYCFHFVSCFQIFV